MRNDIRFGIRTLFNNPGFTAVAVLALALGIGGNTAMFTIIRSVLLKPLPYADSDRLATLNETFLPNGIGTVSTPNFLDWRAQTKAFQSLSAYTTGSLNLQGIGNPERIPSLSATANFFAVLGVSPKFGRTFATNEDQDSAADVALISESLWARRFGANPNILGKTMVLDGAPFTVIGVMPASFAYPPNASIAPELFVPLKFAGERLKQRGSHWMWVIGRLSPGVALDSARAEMNTIAERLEKAYPLDQTGRRVLVAAMRDTVVQRVRSALTVLMSAVGLVLLIACANVANLLLARAAVRQREVAIRSALGAGRAALIRQFLTESVLLSLAGGIAGAALGKWGVDGLLILAKGTIPRRTEIGFDPTVFAFLLGVCVVTGVLFGIIPALQASRTDLNESLKEGGAKGAVGAGRGLFRNGLVVAEIALSFVLLVGAGLLMKAFLRLQATPAGIDTHSVLTFHISPPKKQFETKPLYEGFYQPVLERIRETPGVRGAGAIQMLPIASWGWNGEFGIEGRPQDPPGKEPYTEWRFVTPGYFQAFKIPIVRGRDIDDRDKQGSQKVVLVNETLANRYFKSTDPVGRHIGADRDEWMTIVGVVRDVKQAGLDRAPRAEAYIPLAQTPELAQTWTEMALVVSADVDPASLTSAMRAAVSSVAPDQPIFGIHTMEDVVSSSLSDRRLYLVLIAVFAGIAVALACAGVYGVLSYLVAQRTREFGVRMALGASAGHVVRSILKDSLILASIGVAIGVAGALAASRVLQQMLFEVKPTDPAVYATVAAAILAVVVAASLVPARRAMRVDPMVALRWE